MPKLTKQGVIVKKLDQRTVKVRTSLMKSHPIYKKRFKVVKHYLADDAQDIYAVGDVVVIEESRPLSRTKRFVVVGKVGERNMLGSEKIEGEEILAADRKKEEIEEVAS